jgi:hypothetical protein
VPRQSVPDQQNITQIDPIEWKNVAEMLILTSIKNETKNYWDEPKRPISFLYSLDNILQGVSKVVSVCMKFIDDALRTSSTLVLPTNNL